MATGWGVDAVKNAQGEVTSGTSAQDIRRVLSGIANQGIMYGCEVNTSTSEMKYTITKGVVMNALVWGEHVLMPVYDTSITVSPNNTNSTRTDYVYVKQNMPEVDGNNNIVVGVTNTEPGTYDRRYVLRKFSVPPGATTTSKATRVGSIDYSTPYGQSGRLLVNKLDTYNGALRNRSLNDLGGSFSLTTDRIIRVDMTVTFDKEPTITGSQSDRLMNYIHVDGVQRATFSTGHIESETYTTQSWSWYTQLNRGEHNITLKRASYRKLVHNLPSTLWLRYNANAWPGQTLIVSDAGVAD